jgi:hypothetical protein
MDDNVIQLPKKPVETPRFEARGGGWYNIYEMIADAMKAVSSGEVKVGGAALIIYHPDETAIYRYRLSPDDIYSITTQLAREHPDPSEGGYDPDDDDGL